MASDWSCLTSQGDLLSSKGMTDPNLERAQIRGAFENTQDDGRRGMSLRGLHCHHLQHLERGEDICVPPDSDSKEAYAAQAREPLAR